MEEELKAPEVDFPSWDFLGQILDLGVQMSRL